MYKCFVLADRSGGETGRHGVFYFLPFVLYANSILLVLPEDKTSDLDTFPCTISITTVLNPVESRVRTSFRKPFLGGGVIALEKYHFVRLHATDKVPLLALGVLGIENLHVLALRRGGILRLSALRWLENLGGNQIVVVDTAGVAKSQRVASNARDRSPDIDDTPAAAIL